MEYKFRAWDGFKIIPPCDFWISADGHAAIFNRIKVIGNSFENPELLK